MLTQTQGSNRAERAHAILSGRDPNFKNLDRREQYRLVHRFLMAEGGAAEVANPGSSNGKSAMDRFRAGLVALSDDARAAATEDPEKFTAALVEFEAAIASKLTGPGAVAARSRLRQAALNRLSTVYGAPVELDLRGVPGKTRVEKVIALRSQQDPGFASLGFFTQCLEAGKLIASHRIRE